MPRLRFEQEQDFLSAIKRLVTKPSNFVCFVTTDNELVIYPTVSTKPSFVLYMGFNKRPQDIISKILSEGISVLNVSKVDWDPEKTLQSPQ